MDTDPLPSILDAIARGRGQRGASAPEAWVRHRAQVLIAALTGLHQVRLAGHLGMSPSHLRTLLDEACDAVLRAGAVSPEADAACTPRWQQWCTHGDAQACARLPSPLP